MEHIARQLKDRDIDYCKGSNSILSRESQNAEVIVWSDKSYVVTKLPSGLRKVGTLKNNEEVIEILTKKRF